MSKEWIFNILVNLGFSETDAKVYVHLLSKGPQEARKIADTLTMYRVTLYKTLKNLKNKGIVNSSKGPTLFSAEPFEKALDLLIKDRMKQQHSLEENREKLLSTWQSIIKKDSQKTE